VVERLLHATGRAVWFDGLHERLPDWLADAPQDHPPAQPLSGVTHGSTAGWGAVLPCESPDSMGLGSLNSPLQQRGNNVAHVALDTLNDDRLSADEERFLLGVTKTAKRETPRESVVYQYGPINLAEQAGHPTYSVRLTRPASGKRPAIDETHWFVTKAQRVAWIERNTPKSARAKYAGCHLIQDRGVQPK
jgi:hypothetical protein